MSNIEKYVHISFHSTTDWELLVLDKINTAHSNNKIKKCYPKDENILLYVALRLNMIHALKTFLNKNIHEFMNSATKQLNKDPNCEFTQSKNGFALRGIDKNCIYSQLLNIDPYSLKLILVVN